MARREPAADPPLAARSTQPTETGLCVLLYPVCADSRFGANWKISKIIVHLFWGQPPAAAPPRMMLGIDLTWPGNDRLRPTGRPETCLMQRDAAMINSAQEGSSNPYEFPRGILPATTAFAASHEGTQLFVVWTLSLPCRICSGLGSSYRVSTHSDIFAAIRCGERVTVTANQP